MSFFIVLDVSFFIQDIVVKKCFSVNRNYAYVSIFPDRIGIRNMAIRIFILSLILSFFIPAHAVGFEIIKIDEVTIKYEKGLSGVSNEIARLIPTLKEEIQKRTGLPINFSFEIVIYRHREIFRSLVRNDMIAAFAIPGEDLIVLDYSQFRYDSLTLKLIIMHEMCHLLLHKNIAGNNLPKWFDEGVSQWVSGGINEIVYPQSTRE